jgi:kynurenine formamidase
MQSRSTAVLTEAGFRDLYDRLRGSVPWPPDDRRGALNYLGPEQVRAAAAEVRLGRSVSLGAPVEARPAADNPEPARHPMTGTADQAAATGLSFATDRLEMNVHGNVDSHLDALCHIMYDGHLYNGVPASAVTPKGAVELSLDLDADGIVGRGVLLDIPPLRGVPWLEPGGHVLPEDLLAAEEAQGVRVGRGDLLFVRVGHRQRRDELGAWDVASERAGLHPAAMEFIAERQVAVLGSDSNSDTAGSDTVQTEFPVHVLAINALGVQLLDYLQFEELVPVCRETGRWSFLCVIAPLRLPAGTGSPVNPIAIL